MDKKRPVGKDGLTVQEVIFPHVILAGSVVAIPRPKLKEEEVYVRDSKGESVTDGGVDVIGATPTPVTPKLPEELTLGGVEELDTSIVKLPILVPSALVTLIEKFPSFSFK